MTNIFRCFSALSVAVVFFSCLTQQGNPGNKPGMRPGEWELLFDISDSVPGVKIPIRLIVDSTGTMSIHNDGEAITLEEVRWNGDSIHLKAPFFQAFLHAKVLGDSALNGFLHEPTRAALYAIPFVGSFIGSEIASDGMEKQLIYDATFSKGVEGDQYKAVAMLRLKGDYVSGTFLTETGDYRFLQGEISDQEKTITLSCWDGAHLFYFDGEMDGDSIRNGRFCSGIHWHEPWEARLDPTARLRDPDSLTYVIPGSGEFQFSVKNLDGDSIHFGKAEFKDAVTIVQLYGSWCPNCTDESLFMKELFAKYSNKGLNIIPVAFERNPDPTVSAEIVSNQFRELGIPYEAYLGKGRGKAKETFPMLNHVMSMPTTIFIDKKGNVRKIHTGFYGPGTGDYYAKYTERLELFVQQLLAE